MRRRDPGISMWVEACELLERAERLHRQFFQLGRTVGGQPSWQPPIDVFETSQELWILVALPGVEPGRIEVTVDGGVLVITGEWPIPAEAHGAVIHRMEIPHGRFERQIQLPAGLFELRRRDFAHGCLTLSLLKRD